MGKRLFSYLLMLSIALNTMGQSIKFDDGKVQIYETRVGLEDKGCGTKDWHYVKIELTVVNNSGNPITINKLTANFPTDITSYSKYVGGAFYPCDMPFGWTAKGQDFITTFNQNLSNGQKYIHAMYAWIYVTLDKVDIKWDLKYFERSTGSSNQQTNNATTTKTNTQSQPNSLPQSIKTKYYIESGQLVIDNGDTRELKLISKMTPTEISYYENLSGLKLTSANPQIINQQKSNQESQPNQSNVNANNNFALQQDQKQKAYEEFKQKQLEQQQKEFNEHIQRQKLSNQNFNELVTLSGNIFFDIINAGKAKKYAWGESFGLSLKESINNQKESIFYYKLSEDGDGYTIDWEKIKTGESINLFSENKRKSSSELSSFFTFIDYLTVDLKPEFHEDYGDEILAKRNRTEIIVRFGSYKGSVKLQYNSLIFCSSNPNLLRFTQSVSAYFYRQDGISSDEQAYFGFKNAVGSRLRYPVCFTLLDIMGIKDVSNKAVTSEDDLIINYPENTIEITLRTGEYVHITVKQNPDEFVRKSNELLELYKKEYFEKGILR